MALKHVISKNLISGHWTLLSIVFLMKLFKVNNTETVIDSVSNSPTLKCQVTQLLRGLLNLSLYSISMWVIVILCVLLLNLCVFLFFQSVRPILKLCLRFLCTVCSFCLPVGREINIVNTERARRSLCQVKSRFVFNNKPPFWHFHCIFLPQVVSSLCGAFFIALL